MNVTPTFLSGIQISAEMRLLIECARWPRKQTSAETLLELAAAGIEWRIFLALIRRHRIAGLVENAIAYARISLPAGAREELAGVALTNAMLELRSAAESARLAGLIEAAGIEVTVLKGATVAALAFGRYGVRYSMDIDLLVDPGAITRTSKLLRGAGYVRIEPVEEADEREIDARLGRYKDMVFEHPETDILIELHWRLFQNPRLFAGALSRTRESMPIGGGRTVAVLSPEIAVLYLCVHGGEHGWARLKWLADLNAILARGHISANALYMQAHSRGLTRWIGPGLLLCAEVFGTVIPERLARDLKGSWRMRWLLTNCRTNLIGDQQGTELEDIEFGSTKKNLGHYLASDDPRYWLYEARYDLFDGSASDVAGPMGGTRLLKRVGGLAARLAGVSGKTTGA